MVQFTPYPQAENDPNYLGLSKEPGPIKPNVGLGKLFEGMGDMFEMGVKGLDRLQKSSAEQATRDELQPEINAEIARQENINKAYGGGSALNATGPQGADAIPNADGTASPLSFADTGKGATAPFDAALRTDSSDTLSAPAPLPGDLQGGLARVTRLAEANTAGKYSSTAMNMNAQAIISDLRQRYPGYQAQIDKTAHGLGFGSQAYLADLRTQNNQMVARMDAKDTKDAAWEDKHADEIARLDPNYFNMPRDVRRSDAYRDNLMGQISKLQARNSTTKEEITDLELKVKRNDGSKIDASQVSVDGINTILATSMTGTMNVMGYPNITALVNDMNSGKDHTPEEVKNMNAALEQFRQKHILAATNYLNTTKVGNTTLAGLLGPDKVKQIVTDSALPIETIQRGISEKNYSLASASAMESQMRLDRVGLQISKDYPITDKVGVLEKKYGTAGMQYIIQNNPSIQAGMSAPALQLLTGGTMAIGAGKTNPATGQPMTVNDLLGEFKRLGVTDPKTGKVDPNDAASVLDHVKSNILSNPSKEAASAFARATFTSDLFARVPAKEKLSFLTNYANPAMTQRMLELSKNDPDLLQQYKTFINTGVLASTQQTVSDFKTVQNSNSTAFNANPYYKMTFNPDTNRVDLTMTPTESIYAELGQTPSRYANINAQLRVVRNTVADLNKGLGVLDPVLKSEKKNISGEMLQLLKSTGVKVDIPASTGSPALKFTDDELPSSGNVSGDLGSFIANPAGNKTPVLAQGGGPKKNTNLTAEDLLSISTDDIPEGMSAQDFLKQLRAVTPKYNGAAHAKYRDE